MQRSRSRRGVAAMVLGVALVAIRPGNLFCHDGPRHRTTGHGAGGHRAGGYRAGRHRPRRRRRGRRSAAFAPSDTTDGDLSGFAGTTPLTDRPDFWEQICGVDPQLVDFNYAGEAYDAVVITALAVETAQDDGIAYASEINGITREGTKCTSFAECRDLIAAGEDIDYDGISGPLEFDGNGEPTQASYGLLRMARQQPHRPDAHRVHRRRG